MALIMVLGAITVLTVFLTELQEETSAELSAALAERDALKAEYYARSAVNLSRLLIATGPVVEKEIKSFIPFIKSLPQIPIWEAADLVLAPFNDMSSAGAFASFAGLDATEGKNMGLTGGGKFEVLVVDENSKLNLNTPAQNNAISAQRFAQQFIGLIGGPQYNTMFEEQDADAQFTDRATLCGAIADWADADPTGNEVAFVCDPFSGNAPVAQGSEDAFYQQIGLPYVRKNAAFDSVEELRLVRGVGDDFWATFVDPEPDDPRKRVMTVWGQGEVNVNSAHALPLLGVICANAPDADYCPTSPAFDPLQLQQFLMGLNLLKNFVPPGVPVFDSEEAFLKMLEGKGMYGSVLQTLGIKPAVIKDRKGFKRQITTRSKVFSIYATGVMPGFKKELRLRIHAVVDMRSAPVLGAEQGLGAAAAGAAVNQGARAGSVFAPSPSRGAAQPGGPSAQDLQNLLANPNAIAQALKVNPGGTIIYWRVE